MFVRFHYNSFIDPSLSRVFTREEIQIIRTRMPTEIKPFTGLYKWKDLKNWHRTWHAFLCEYLCTSTDYLWPLILENSSFILRAHATVRPVRRIE